MKLQMAHEGKGFWGDGISLSWASGREPEVIEVSDNQDEWPFRLRQRFMNGNVIVTDKPVTEPLPEPTVANRLMAGGSPEAIAHMAIPAPEVVRARAITTEETMGLPPPPQPTGWAAKSVRDLRVELKNRGLPQAGNKAEMVARLDEDDAKAAADAPQAEMATAVEGATVEKEGGDDSAG